MSEEAALHGDHPNRSLGARLMDLFVYAPAGAVLSALDDLPATAAEGRERIEQELRNAHLVGRFAVDLGVRQLRHQVQLLLGDRAGADGGPTADGPTGEAFSEPVGPPEAPDARSRSDQADGAVATGPGGIDAVPAGVASAGPPPPGAPSPGAPARDPAVDLAIPDYDALSASQVVRRLDGLGPDELRAVERHELAGRGRRTIVSRAQQLLAAREPGEGPAA